MAERVMHESKAVAARAVALSRLEARTEKTWAELIRYPRLAEENRG